MTRTAAYKLARLYRAQGYIPVVVRQAPGHYTVQRGERAAIPRWTTSMAGEPDIGMLPDGTLNVVREDDTATGGYKGTGS